MTMCFAHVMSPFDIQINKKNGFKTLFNQYIVTAVNTLLPFPNTITQEKLSNCQLFNC